MPSVRLMIRHAERFPSVVKLRMEGVPREVRYVRERTCRNADEDEGEHIDGDFRCSECGVFVGTASHSEPITFFDKSVFPSAGRWKFCPNCGAKVIE